jgi:hypothetical protein
MWVGAGKISKNDPDPYSDPDPDPGGQKWPTKVEKRKKLYTSMW